MTSPSKIKPTPVRREKKVTVYKVWDCFEEVHMIFADKEHATEYLEELKKEAKFEGEECDSEVEIDKMTEDEFNSLPEY